MAFSPLCQEWPFGSYEEALSFLFQAVDYEKLTKYKYQVPDFDLGRVERFLAEIGNPHLGLRVVHVAGTKGKGSTATMTAQFLKEAGLKVGLFTSPHLVHLEERIKIDGEMIPKEDVSRLLGYLRPYVERERKETPRLSSTFFEILTAMAFLYFKEQEVDWAVLEVGLGGRLDATNVITPRVSVITEVSFDHTDKLGSTLREIAWEKGGIIKEGVPVVSSAQSQEALITIQDICKKRHSTLYLVGRDIEVLHLTSIPLYGFGCDIRTWRREYQGLRLPLLGEHQAHNCATALGAMEVLAQSGELEWDEGLARRALASLRCPGRIEVVANNPLIVLDSAHNVSSIRALVRTLRRDLDFQRLILILGVSRDKDILGILREVAGVPDELIFTRAPSPRAAEPDFLAQEFRTNFGREGKVVEEAEEALRLARSLAQPGDCICVTGSFYLAGRIKEIMEEGVKTS
ncbi:MAG TPA: bifunctional folylpolyglutamate synthase/dihydrofolate synthase [Candidatus Hypogeohydataceae bacterium YC38]